MLKKMLILNIFALMVCLSGCGKTDQLLSLIHIFLMVTHDPNAASFCTRILFIQDGVIFHEIRKDVYKRQSVSGVGSQYWRSTSSVLRTPQCLSLIHI